MNCIEPEILRLRTTTTRLRCTALRMTSRVKSNCYKIPALYTVQGVKKRVFGRIAGPEYSGLVTKNEHGKELAFTQLGITYPKK